MNPTDRAEWIDQDNPADAAKASVTLTRLFSSRLPKWPASLLQPTNARFMSHTNQLIREQRYALGSRPSALHVHLAH